jgi:hypothetical protein
MHSINPKRIKVTDEPKDKNDMQVWLAKVLKIKNSVEFLKWTEEKVLPYQLTDYFISNEVDNRSFLNSQELWMVFRNCGSKVLATFRGGERNMR